VVVGSNPAAPTNFTLAGLATASRDVRLAARQYLPVALDGP
jgi:hypothetical protein